MKDSINKIAAKLIEISSLEELHLATKEWLSELNFMADEVKFLRDLIDHYFAKLISSERIEHTKEIVVGIARFRDMQLGKVQEMLLQHERNLANIADNDVPLEEEAYREEHERLWKEMSQLHKAYKAIKKDVFQFTEKAIHDEKLKHLLT